MSKKDSKALPLNDTPTVRGFSNFEFTDDYGRACRVQKSSLAEKDCIWLGLSEADIIRDPLTGEDVICCRMHLSRENVAALLPILKRFVKTGEIRE